MGWKGSHYAAIKTLGVFTLVLVVFSFTFLTNVFTRGGSVRISSVTVDEEAWRVVLAAGTSVQASAIGVSPSATSMRIRIPGIGVDAAIERVGLEEDGSMGVPSAPMDAAWYSLGPRPGQSGSAVMAGHVDWYGGVTGVFADLRALKPGDEIVVLDEDGSETAFIVRALRTYGSNDDATDVFVSTDGKAHLNLITCGGTWNKSTGEYTERLVVFADKVER